MHTIIHRAVVLTILVAGVLLARLYPVAERVEVPTDVAPEAIASFRPLIEKPESEQVETFSVRKPVQPVASPESLGVFKELAAAPSRTTEADDEVRQPAAVARELNGEPPENNTQRPKIESRRESRSRRQRIPMRREPAARRETASTNRRRRPPERPEPRRQRRRGRLTTHRIADGDDLPFLAGKYLLDEKRYREIFDLNRQILTHPDLLPVGKEIQVYDERE